MSKAHLWFAGTPEFAAYSLRALIDCGGYAVDGVLTQPDRPAGRGRKLAASAVKQTALAHGIPVAQPDKLRADVPPFPELRRPDVVVVAAYGMLLPRWFLQYPRLGCLNIHGSLLPRWRGAAPIQRAIEAGDTETGIGIMQMDEGLDTGAVWLQKRTPITDTTTAPELHDKLMALGAQALLEALPIVLAGNSKPTPQPEKGAVYAHKLTKAEAALNFAEDAQIAARKVRAFAGFPVAHAQLGSDAVRIHAAIAIDNPSDQPAGVIIAHDKRGITAACGRGALCITQLQFPGRQIVSAAELRNSRDLTGERFS